MCSFPAIIVVNIAKKGMKSHERDEVPRRCGVVKFLV